MDPRPYHFQFRKPRLSNPTFQSNNLYDSMYQINLVKTQRLSQQRNPESYRYKNSQSTKPASEPDKVRRNQSMQLQKVQKVEMMRYPSMSKQKMYAEKKVSKLSNYGYNLMKVQLGAKSSRMDQTQIFDKQQHNFDIINYKPTSYRARLKMFPKLTLEDKINQRYGSPLKQNL